MSLSRPLRFWLLWIIAIVLLLATLGELLLWIDPPAGRSQTAALPTSSTTTAIPAAITPSPSPAPATLPAVVTSTQAVLPTATPTPPAEPTALPTVELDPSGWQRVHMVDPAITFSAPPDWVRSGADWIWKSDATSPLRVGLTWESTAGGDWQPENMLPPEGEVTSVTDVDLGWGSGQSYRLKIESGGRLLALEQHMIVPVSGDLAYDFFCSAPTFVELASLDPVLKLMAGSVTFGVSSGDPIEVAVLFLTAALRGEDIDPYLMPALRGQPADALLGLPATYSRFNVSSQGEQEGQVLIQATLTFGERQEIRTLVLSWQEEGGWLVDAIQ